MLILLRTSVLTILFGLTFVHASLSQSKGHFEFLEHLNSIKEYEEGITYIDFVLSNGAIQNGSFLDSLHFLKGKFSYYLADQEKSIGSFQMVSADSPNYLESQLLLHFQRAYTGNILEAKNGFNQLLANDRSLIVPQLQISGISLLERDLNRYDGSTENWKDDYGQTYIKFEEIKTAISTFNSKSPLAAGMLSAVVPGLGKIYLGKIGEGITTLLATSIFALQAIEGYNKDGPRSGRFIFFTSVFSGFYISNIVGSALAVEIRKNEFNEQTNNAILVAMHVPLRVLFD